MPKINTEVPQTGVALVDFYADWCSPCTIQSKVLAGMESKLPDGVKIIKINTDKNPILAQQHQVQSLPTLVFFKEGVEVDRSIGLTAEGHLIQKMKELTSI